MSATLDYADYIDSEAWLRRRGLYLLTHDYASHRCHSWQNLHLHHRTYVRLGAELDADLCWLCATCHAAQHRTGTLDPGPARPITDDEARLIAFATRAQRAIVVERELLNRFPAWPADVRAEKAWTVADVFAERTQVAAGRAL